MSKVTVTSEILTGSQEPRRLLENVPVTVSPQKDNYSPARRIYSCCLSLHVKFVKMKFSGSHLMTRSFIKENLSVTNSQLGLSFV